MLGAEEAMHAEYAGMQEYVVQREQCQLIICKNAEKAAAEETP
jgi:hypothetical protein